MAASAREFDNAEHRTTITRGRITVTCSCGWKAVANTEEEAEREQRAHSRWETIRRWEQPIQNG